jgi:hypothetical protein
MTATIRLPHRGRLGRGRPGLGRPGLGRPGLGKPGPDLERPSAAEYRVYFIDQTNQVSRPPKVVECAHDEEAIQAARQFIGGEDVELWDGTRLIVRFPHE